MSTPEPPRRPRLDQMADNDLDALYARLEALEGRACEASLVGPFNTPIGPCTLRHGHGGPVHRAPDGATWWRHPEEPAPDSLRDQYATAISRVLLDSAGRLVPQHIAETAQAVRDTTDAILAVRDTEIQQLRDELAAERDVSRRLLDQRQEMAAERYAWQERGDRAEQRAERAAAECDRIEEEVRTHLQGHAYSGAYLAAIRRIRAALDEPTHTKEQCDCPPTQAGLELCPRCPDHTTP
ncbi:hypothetical protein [Streptomyces sp. CC228A]|uniref:hypothetical protein n=1 Tax=Streptomyces sp. CC228A TaxID=2898186 RepID=UPI001F2AE8E9|nr:hypothetical protein [Streptomyces sp. CC228A]